MPDEYGISSLKSLVVLSLVTDACNIWALQIPEKVTNIVFSNSSRNTAPRAVLESEESLIFHREVHNS